MIYPNVRVPLPNVSGFVQQRNDIRYLFAYLTVSTKEGGKRKRPPAKMIGRIEVNVNGIDELMPNDNYYDLSGIQKPSVATAEGAGRKPELHNNPIDQRPISSEIDFGYGFVVYELLAEEGLIQALEDAFPEKIVSEIIITAAFLCDGPHSSFAELNEFVQSELFFNEQAPSYDRRRAGEVLVKLSTSDRGIFYKSWIKRQTEGKISNVFYDVTSFSTYSEKIQMAEFGYNRDSETWLKQINEGLFCLKENGLPLFMASYQGSLNDKQNFNNVISRASSLGLNTAPTQTTVIIDGGFSKSNFNWAHLNGYTLVAGVSSRTIKKITTLYVDWCNSLTNNDYLNSWTVNGIQYLSHHLDCQIGGVDGTIILYKNLKAEEAKTSNLVISKEQKLNELASLHSCCPYDDFDNWAKSYEPLFKISKVDKKHFSYEFNQEEFKKQYNLCGSFCIFTTLKPKKVDFDKEILILYRNKESVENSFDTTKNALCDKRLHVHGDSQVEGKLFAIFISLILWRIIEYRLKSWLKNNNYTVHDAIRLLKHIKYIKLYENKWSLKDNLSKTHKSLLENLNLDWDRISNHIKAKKKNLSNANMTRNEQENKPENKTDPKNNKPFNDLIKGFMIRKHEVKTSKFRSAPCAIH